MKKILCIPGDGIGPELMAQARLVLSAIGKFELSEENIGYEVYKKTGASLPESVLESAKKADAVLFGAVTSPPYSITDYRSAILALRKELDLYANVRPCKSFPNTKSLFKDVDLTIVRENTEGLYAGIEWVEDDGSAAYAKRVITRKGSERIAKYAFEYAKKHGKKKVTAVHKANVLRKTDGLFLECVRKVAAGYPEIAMEDEIVDAMAMRLIKHPQDFSVIVTTNLFGDILSDEAAQVVGGLGMAPSMNYGDKHALFEPAHGSAPKYAGKDLVNPCAMLLSTAMMLDYLGEEQNAKRLEDSIRHTLEGGKTLTKDLGGSAKTSEMVNAIIKGLD